MPNRIKPFLKLLWKVPVMITALLVSNFAMAAGSPETSSLNNPIAIMMIIIMIILLLIIALLANVLLGTADFYSQKVKKKEQEKETSSLPVITVLTGLMACSFPVMAQDAGKNASASSISGMSASTFYLMAGIIFLEIVVIMILLINVRILIAKEKQRTATAPVMNKRLQNWWNDWWNKANKFKPVHEEVKIDLGH